LVKEEGEVHQNRIIDELTGSIVSPTKLLSFVRGVSRLAIMPISGMMHLAGKVKNKKKKKMESKTQFFEFKPR
jgi:hypothetical protein